MPGPLGHEPGGRLLLHAQGGGPAVVLEDLLQVGGAVAAGRVDAVEPLGVAAGVVVKFQPVVAADPQLVRDRADRHAVEDDRLGFEVLVGQLEAVVPERDLAGAQLLRLLPVGDPVGPALADLGVVEVDLTLNRLFGVAVGRVGQDHRVAVGVVAEEVVNALFFHQPAGEVQVGLAVLHAVVAGEVGALKLIGDVEALRAPRLRISGTVLCWKIRLCATRVRNQNCGTISSR